MTKYLLDTNIIAHQLRENYGIEQIILSKGWENIYVSEATIAELKYGESYAKLKGIKVKNSIEKYLQYLQIIPISCAIEMFANEKARLRIAGTPVENDFDILIGCTSVVKNMIMVTENIKDFKNISNIKIENWVVRK